MLTNGNWFQASALMLAGSGVRRAAWHKWLYWQHNLGWIFQPTLLAPDVPTDTYTRVVLDTDFTVAEFNALDWTDQPWDGTTNTFNVLTNGDGTGGSGGSGLDKNVNQNIWNALAGNSGGGGASGGSSTTGTTQTSTAPNPQLPTITVTCTCLDTPTGGACWTGPAPATFRMSVNIAISGGPAGVGGLSIKFQGRTVLCGNGSDGYNAATVVADATLTPGANFVVTAFYAADSRAGFSPGTLWQGVGTMTNAPVCGTPPPSITYGIDGTVGYVDTHATGTVAASGDVTDSSGAWDIPPQVSVNPVNFTSDMIAGASITFNGGTPITRANFGNDYGWDAAVWIFDGGTLPAGLGALPSGANTVVVTASGFTATFTFTVA
jgi:hypothetical protein